MDPTRDVRYLGLSLLSAIVVLRIEALLSDEALMDTLADMVNLDHVASVLHQRTTRAQDASVRARVEALFAPYAANAGVWGYFVGHFSELRDPLFGPGEGTGHRTPSEILYQSRWFAPLFLAKQAPGTAPRASRALRVGRIDAEDELEDPRAGIPQVVRVVTPAAAVRTPRKRARSPGPAEDEEHPARKKADPSLCVLL